MIPFPFQAAGFGLAQQPASGGGGGSLYSEIMADSPVYYFRHAEPSGTTMENEVGTDGTYAGSGVTLGSAALYTGGPTSVRLPSSGGSGYGQKTGGTLPALTAMTLMCIVQFNASLASGLKGLISNDNGSSPRTWQWRMSGGTMQFVKVAGPEVASFATGFTTGVNYMLHVTITSGGAVTIYVNGVSVHTTTFAATDYGSVAEIIQIGFSSAGVGLANAFFSESAIFATALNSTRITAHKTAGGF